MEPYYAFPSQAFMNASVHSPNALINLPHETRITAKQDNPNTSTKAHMNRRAPERNCDCEHQASPSHKENQILAQKRNGRGTSKQQDASSCEHDTNPKKRKSRSNCCVYITTHCPCSRHTRGSGPLRRTRT